MRSFRTILKIIGVSLCLVFLFRGYLYRTIVSYKDVGSRSYAKINNQHLIAIINSKQQDGVLDLSEIVSISRSVTNENLSFTFDIASNDPNKIFSTQKSNCIGYSALFNSVANYLIEENNLSHKLRATHKIGQLSVLGFDIHQFFDDPFYKDHDYNIVKNLTTGELIVIDPSLSDYCWVHSVNQR